MATGDGTSILNSAISQFRSLPYTWGDNDCSGIVQKVFNQAGYNLPRVSSAQWGAVQHISENQLQPGDLVFYNPGGAGAPPGLPGHVAIYAGGGMTFQALNPSTPIGFGSVHDPNLTLVGFGRVPGVNGGAPSGTAVVGGGTAPAGGTTAPAVDQPTHTGSTCAIGFKNNIPVVPQIYTQTVSACIISKPMARAGIAALLISAGVGVGLTGAAMTLVWGTDQTSLGHTLISVIGIGKVAGVGKMIGRAA